MAILWSNFKWRTRFSEHKKHGVYNSYSPTRINRLLRLLNMYIWIAILLCCVHLGAAQTTTTPTANMTQNTSITQNASMTTEELTTIAVTDLLDVTTSLTTKDPGEEGPPLWIYGVAAAGGVILIVIIIIIIICVKKRCRCGTPPAPVGLDREITYNRGYTDENQDDIRLEMNPQTSGIEDPIYENTAIPPQVNAGFDYSHQTHSLDDDFPSVPPPAPPIGASSNINVDTRPAVGILSPFLPTLPSPGPPSPQDDIPDRPPPAVPTPGLKDIKPDKKTKKKKEKKKEKKEDKPKSPKRYIDPKEQVREEVLLKPTHNLDSAKPKPKFQPKFGFKSSSPTQKDVADFGENYEDIAPVDSSPAEAWSPRQQEEGGFGGDYEDVDCDGSEDYDDEYEVMDPNAQPQKPLGMKQAMRVPSDLPGQRGGADLNQRPMVPPPMASKDDFGDEYEVVSPSDLPKHRLPGKNIDHRQGIPIPSQDHGEVYDDVDNSTVTPKRKPQMAKPKTAKKSPKPPPGDDFGQEYGNTGNRIMFPVSTTQRRPPTLPSSSNLPQAEEEDDDWYPPPPPEIDQRPPMPVPSPDYGAQYDDVAIKPTIKKKPPVPKPKVSKKPSNTGSSSTLPVNPKQQLSLLEARSVATLPISGGQELIEEGEEDSVYMNLEVIKGKGKHYQNLPTPEKPQEQITSSGYSYFSERPK